MATAHATSKIRSFQDIYEGSEPLTMGFRGEALFCLSNLSRSLIVATRCANEEFAQKLVFRRDGSLDPNSGSVMPRKVGTTVAVVGLMEALPVRRADMIRRIAAQRGRLMKIVIGYAIFSVGVRINLMDIIGSGGQESTLLATTFNSTSIQETISSVLGSKFLMCLGPICLDLASVFEAFGGESEESNEAYEGPKKWKVEGLIAKALHTRDRGVKDAQFFSINGRPVDIPKVSKRLNEVWKTFGGQKRPSCVLQFTLPNNSFDINLSPDKREVMLTQEDQICAIIQEGITKLWASQTDGKFTANSISGQEKTSQRETGYASDDAATARKPVAEFESPMCSPSRFNRRYAFSHDFSKAKMQHEFDDGRNTGRVFKGSTTDQDTETIQWPSVIDESIKDTEEKKQDDMSDTEEEVAEDIEKNSVDPSTNAEEQVIERRELSAAANDTSAEKAPCSLEAVTPSPVNAFGAESTNKVISLKLDKLTDAERHRWNQAQQDFNSPGSAGFEEEIQSVKKMNFDRFRAPVDGQSLESSSRNRSTKTQSLEKFGFQVSGGEISASKTLPVKRLPPIMTREEISVSKTLPVKRLAPKRAEETSLAPKRPKRRGNESPSEDQNDHVDTERADSSEEEAMDDETEIPPSTVGGTDSSATVVWSSFKGTSDVMQAALLERLAMRDRKRRFQDTTRAPSNSNANKPSEVKGEVEQVAVDTISLSKGDFSSMTVIGQFNLGFILARSQDNHLWILDQHACDEKFNFEKLCVETVIHEQKLIAPMPLELSPSEETCIMDHMEIFEKNGFRFSHDPDKAPRHRLSLTALPHSGARDGRKAVQFGKEDVSALCGILGADGSASSYDGGAGGGTGADGSGMYGNNAVRRYAGTGAGDTADKIIARLPKAIAMFASRACRGSIMIGKPLSIKEMDRIVKRLEDVEHPWNCPHGRPTMRHVGNVAQIMLEDEKKAAGHIAGPTVTVMSQEVDEES
jgi:DNA mismatch repair protein PMS2